jgi:hypothetical protein
MVPFYIVSTNDRYYQLDNMTVGDSSKDRDIARDVNMFLA